MMNSGLFAIVATHALEYKPVGAVLLAADDNRCSNSG